VIGVDMAGLTTWTACFYSWRSRTGGRQACDRAQRKETELDSYSLRTQMRRSNAEDGRDRASVEPRAAGSAAVESVRHRLQQTAGGPFDDVGECPALGGDGSRGWDRGTKRLSTGYMGELMAAVCDTRLTFPTRHISPLRPLPQMPPRARGLSCSPVVAQLHPREACAMGQERRTGPRVWRCRQVHMAGCRDCWRETQSRATQIRGQRYVAERIHVSILYNLINTNNIALDRTTTTHLASPADTE